MTKKNIWRSIRLGLPDKIEGFFLGGMFLFLYWQDVLQNKFQDLGLGHQVTWITGITTKAINLFWVTIIFYHIFLFSVIARSIWLKRSTHHYLDFIIGAIMIIGIFFVITGAIAGIYFETNVPIEWFFNITQINIYHIGIAIQIIGALYFSITK